MITIETDTHSSKSLPVLLALDTSSKRTSLALARGHQIIANFEVELDDNRSARLWELIDFVLESVGLKITDVEVFAVCIGPGGFTGLRVGIAAVKGLAVAAQKFTVGVTSLEALAASTSRASRVCVLSNAYKGEVYWQIFSFDEGGLPVAESSPAVGVLADALDHLIDVKEVTFVGDGADKNAEAILLFHKTRFDRHEYLQPSSIGWSINKVSGFLAEPIARLAYDKFINRQAVEAEQLKACYVRSADVKIKRV